MAYLVGGLVGLLLGLVLGVRLDYFRSGTLLTHVTDLNNKLYMMKKQGFVPQYEIEQRTTFDPAQDVIEY